MRSCPDLTEHALIGTMGVLVKCSVNGVVLGNTFPSSKMAALPMSKGTRGPRAAPARTGTAEESPQTSLCEYVLDGRFRQKHYPQMSVIACGGIDHGRKVYDLMKLGADAVECYSVVAFRWMAAHAMRKGILRRAPCGRIHHARRILEKNR